MKSKRDTFFLTRMARLLDLPDDALACVLSDPVVAHRALCLAAALRPHAERSLRGFRLRHERQTACKGELQDVLAVNAQTLRAAGVAPCRRRKTCMGGVAHIFDVAEAVRALCRLLGREELARLRAARDARRAAKLARLNEADARRELVVAWLVGRFSEPHADATRRLCAMLETEPRCEPHFWLYKLGLALEVAQSALHPQRRPPKMKSVFFALKAMLEAKEVRCEAMRELRSRLFKLDAFSRRELSTTLWDLTGVCGVETARRAPHGMLRDFLDAGQMCDEWYRRKPFPCALYQYEPFRRDVAEEQAFEALRMLHARRLRSKE